LLLDELLPDDDPLPEEELPEDPLPPDELLEEPELPREEEVLLDDPSSASFLLRL